MYPMREFNEEFIRAYVTSLVISYNNMNDDVMMYISGGEL
jgi:hypothetical protein